MNYCNLYQIAAHRGTEGMMDTILQAEEIFRRLGITPAEGKNLRHRIGAGRASPDRLPPLLLVGNKLSCFESVYNQWVARHADAARALMDRPISPQSGRSRGRPRSKN